MAISFACTGCGKQFSLADELAGRRIQCRCGQQMRVPSPPAPPPAAESAFGLSELEPADPMASLLEGEAVPTAPKLPPVTHKPLKPAVAGPKPPKVKVDRGKLAKVLLIPPLVLGLIGVAGYLLLSTAAKFQPGYDTPEAVLAAYQQTLMDEDPQAQFRLLDPQSQEEATDQIALSILLMSKRIDELRPVTAKYQIAIPPALVVTFGTALASLPDPKASWRFEQDGPYIPPDPAEVEKAAKEAAERLTERALYEQGPARLRLAAAASNKEQFYLDVMKAMAAYDERTASTNPLVKQMGIKAKREVLAAMSKGTLSNVTIDGDQAKGTVSYKLGKLPVDVPVAFRQLNGRWFLRCGSPEEESFVNLMELSMMREEGPGMFSRPF